MKCVKCWYLWLIAQNNGARIKRMMRERISSFLTPFFGKRHFQCCKHFYLIISIFVTSKLSRGVIGNTSDSGSEEFKFETWRDNLERAAIAALFVLRSWGLNVLQSFSSDKLYITFQIRIKSSYHWVFCILYRPHGLQDLRTVSSIRTNWSLTFCGGLHSNTCLARCKIVE